MILRCSLGILIITFINADSLMKNSVRVYSTANNLSSLEYKRIENRPPLPVYNGNEDYLINTTVCTVLNYVKKIKFYDPPDYHSYCGQRFVFVRAVPNNLLNFTISAKHLEVYKKNITNVQCCYQFGRRSGARGIRDRKLIYSKCKEFKNRSVAKLRSSIVTVACYTIENTQEKVYFYQDAYLIYMRNKIITERTKETRPDDGHWNVLMVGVDTMSRGRAYNFLPETIKFLKDNKWIDYRGYNKVGLNTFPNIMAVMSGKYLQDMNGCDCCYGIPNCNQHLMWSQYEMAGYTTAYGEECMHMYVFGQRYGFDKQPTDYYVRPFFVTGERTEGNVQCNGQQSSVKHLLNYAADFTHAYKNGKFFAYFWLNGIGHDISHNPRVHDQDLAAFLKRVSEKEVMDNTFVFLYSDHGILFGGNVGENFDFLVEQRLPMMFIHVPYRFRKAHKGKYYNMMLNENRLTSPYDFHATLWDILKLSNSSVKVIPPEACPQCTSLFNEKSLTRTCADAGIKRQWCSCNRVAKLAVNSTIGNNCVKEAVTYIQNKAKTIKTKPCTTCSELTLKRIYSMAVSQYDNNISLYSSVFKLTPGNMIYEAAVETNGKEYKILLPPHTITPYGPDTKCVINPRDREYCICSSLTNCTIK